MQVESKLSLIMDVIVRESEALSQETYVHARWDGTA
jgi:hypothetical protein